MRSIVFLSGALISLCASSMTVAAADIYRWVDQQGVLHYGAQPPANYKAELVVTGAARSKPAPSPENSAASTTEIDTPQQRALTQQIQKEVAAQTAELKEYCSSARKNLAQLENNPRLTIQTESGEMQRLTEEERQARINETRQGITQHCSPAGL